MLVIRNDKDKTSEFIPATAFSTNTWMEIVEFLSPCDQSVVLTDAWMLDRFCSER